MLIRQNTHRNGKSICPNIGFDGILAIKVREHKNFVDTFCFSLIKVQYPFKVWMIFLRLWIIHEFQQIIPLNIGDRVQRIHHRSLSPEPAGIIEREIDRINQTVFFTGNEFNNEAFRNFKSCKLLLGCINLCAYRLSFF